MSAVPSIKKKPRRLWRWLLRGALFVLAWLVIGVVSLWVRLEWEARQGRKQLAAVVAETDEKDPRWRWEEIQEDLAPIPDRENSALVVKKFADSLGKWKPGERKLPNGRDLFEDLPPVNVRFDDQHLALLREELLGREASVALALSLKDYPRGRATIKLSDDVLGTLLPHADPARQAAYFLRLDLERLLHAGRTKETPDRVRAALRAGASLRDDPMLICALVRVALRSIAVRFIERILGMGELPDGACKELTALLDTEQKENLLLTGLRGDRAGYHRLFENMESGKVSLADLNSAASGSSGKPDLHDRLGFLAYSYRLPDDHAFMLTRFNEMCDLARLPVEEQMLAWAAFDAEFMASRQQARAGSRRIVAHLLTSAGNKVGEATLRDHAQLRCAVTALAAERFRLANKRWPKKLDELCPAFLPAVPLDPFKGEPLLLSPRQDGIVIYSVGKDGEDDGGQIDPLIPGRMADDVGIRLYDADKRGLPPQAPKPQDDD